MPALLIKRGLWTRISLLQFLRFIIIEEMAVVEPTTIFQEASRRQLTGNTVVLEPDADVALSEKYDTFNLGSDYTIVVALEAISGEETQLLMHFDLTGLGSNATSASLKIYSYVNHQITISAYRMLQSWSESTARWSDYDSTSGVLTDNTDAVSTASFQIQDPPAHAYSEIDVLSDVQAWLQGTAPNYGWVFKVTSAAYSSALWDIDAKEGDIPAQLIITPTSYGPMYCPSSVPTMIAPSPSPSSVPIIAPSPLPNSVPTLVPTSTPTSFPTTAPIAVPTSCPVPGPTFSPTTCPTKTPTAEPTMVPTKFPSTLPMSVPTSHPTQIPTLLPSIVPTAAPTSVPTMTPTLIPTASPTGVPSTYPTITPSKLPTAFPTASPTSIPSTISTSAPTLQPTTTPTSVPTMSPTSIPTAVPSVLSTSYPTAAPTTQPTAFPTEVPTTFPTKLPTALPTATPTNVPTSCPTEKPTAIPSSVPTKMPTFQPTAEPTSFPTMPPTSRPTASPTAVPISCPTAAPSNIPTSLPTVTPTSFPTAIPTKVPTSCPTKTPTAVPSGIPSAAPTFLPTAEPTSLPTMAPTALPTTSPTGVPSSCPSAIPSNIPTSLPTVTPTSFPTAIPTKVPTSCPTKTPTAVPSGIPSAAPTFLPTAEPTSLPTMAPTALPTTSPTGVPSSCPTATPTPPPTNIPTVVPTIFPTTMPTSIPTTMPTIVPTLSPTLSPTSGPSSVPTTFPTSPPSAEPTSIPTMTPTSLPTASPTGVPSSCPTAAPTSTPTSLPTTAPSAFPTTPPTKAPSTCPTRIPTSIPSSAPTTFPTSPPTEEPTTLPTMTPTSIPTASPTLIPSSCPTVVPTPSPTFYPTATPTSIPTMTPTGAPSTCPTTVPSSIPTMKPTSIPTASPSGLPSSCPTTAPTKVPSSCPTTTPTAIPSSIPTAAPTSQPIPAPTSVPTISPTSIPSATPTGLPSSCPIAAPTSLPTAVPSVVPSTCPSRMPTSIPTATPTNTPSSCPTVSPTSIPSGIPSAAPTFQPTEEPTAIPTMAPTSIPTASPTGLPSSCPTGAPTPSPTFYPTATPTSVPTATPTKAPSPWPTNAPTSIPSTVPTTLPTSKPTTVPTSIPTMTPTSLPTASPSGLPSSCPTTAPTKVPSSCPTATPTAIPSSVPTAAPTSQPIPAPTSVPTISPTSIPSATPTGLPSSCPIAAPTSLPTAVPSGVPSTCPSRMPTSIPTATPTKTPSSCPTVSPTSIPSGIPSAAPTFQPTEEPTANPTMAPTSIPTASPTGLPSSCPTAVPTNLPTSLPTATPSAIPTITPSELPNPCPTGLPTSIPSSVPSDAPTFQPISAPTSVPTAAPTSIPTAQPTTSLPTTNPTMAPTSCPTATPTIIPSNRPEAVPTLCPTSAPTSTPTLVPTAYPTSCPTAGPTSMPTVVSAAPTEVPTPGPSTSGPTASPTRIPAPLPTSLPSSSSAPTLSCPTLIGPPQLIEARFADVGSGLHLHFNVPTDRGGYGGGAFGCNDIVALSNGNLNENCVFLDDLTLSMTTSTKSTVLPGDIAIITPDTLRTRQDIKCAASQFNMQNNRTILPAFKPVEPLPVINIPEVVGQCTDIVADASASVGGGGRGLSYMWSFSGMSNISAVSTFANSSIIIPYEAFKTEISVMVSLSIVNFLGIASNTISRQILVTPKPRPSLSIVGGSDQTAVAWQSLRLFAEAAVARCDRDSNGNDDTLTYTWTARTNGVELVSISPNPRIFLLSAYSLSPGSEVLATINVSDGLQSNTATTRVTIRRGSVIASIDGLRGAVRSVALNTLTTLDASASYDQDNISTPLTYKWTCTYYEDESDNAAGGFCDNSTSSDGGSRLLIVPAEVGIFHLVVTVTSESVVPSRNDSTWIRLVATDVLPVAVVSAYGQFDAVVNPSVRLGLHGEVSTPHAGNLSFSWSVQNGYLSGNSALESVALSTVSNDVVYVDAGDRFFVPLILEAETLIPEANYIFALTVENKYGAAINTVHIKCNTAPTSGSISTSPSKGTALKTRFTITAGNDWVDTDLPLTYTFFVRAPFNTSSRTMICATSLSHDCQDVVSSGDDQWNAFLVDVSDTYGATSTSDPSSLVYIEGSADLQSVTNLSNFTLPLLDLAIRDSDVDTAYQLMVASAEAVNNIEATQRRLISCDNMGDCSTTSEALFRAKLLEAFEKVILLQVDDIESRARQARMLSALTKAAENLHSSKYPLALSLFTSLALRASAHGLEFDGGRSETQTAFVQSLANLGTLVAFQNDSTFETSYLNALDDTFDAFILGVLAGQNVEAAHSKGYSLAVAKTIESRAMDIGASDDARAFVSNGALLADASVAIAQLDSNVFRGSEGSVSSQSAIRLRVLASDSARRRRLTTDSQVLLTVPQSPGSVSRSMVSTYNVSVDCDSNATIPVAVPCNGTNATIDCNGTAARFMIECRALIGPVCAEYDGSTWLPMSLDDVVDSNSANTTCSIALTSDPSSRAFTSSSNSAIYYYVSALRLTKEPGQLIQQPLLLWIFGTMTTLCLGMAVIGISLDRRDSRRMMRISPRSLVDKKVPQHNSNVRVSLKMIAEASLPRFVSEIGKSRVYFYALAVVLRNHSIFTILTRYKPKQNRTRRSFLVYFTCLMIMLSQVIALWMAFPTGYCESAKTRSDCESRKNLYYELLKFVVEIFFGDRNDTSSDRACEWIIDGLAQSEDACQLQVPSARDIGTKRVLLVFLLFALTLPCIIIMEAFFVKYACAPIWLPSWARESPKIIHFLHCFFKVIDPRKVTMRDDEGKGRFEQTADEDDGGDDDDDFGQNDDFDGGAPIQAESEDGAFNMHRHTMNVRHRVGMRLWRSLEIDDCPGQCSSLEILDFYVLRAVNCVMKSIHLMRCELIAAARSCEHCNETREAINYLVSALDHKWNSFDVTAETGSTAKADTKRFMLFANSVYTQLRRSVEIALHWDNRIERLGVEKPLKACALVVHLMRREHLNPSQQKLLDAEIRNEGAFTTSADWHSSRGDVAPVALRTKLFGILVTMFAFLFPMWIFFILAGRLDAAGRAGKRTKRIIFVKTIVFLFFNYLTVEPLVIIIMKFALPATLYHQLLFYEDPLPLFCPYDTIRLFVEPAALLSPIAGLLFAQLCGRVPIRLGPSSVEYALESIAERKEASKKEKKEVTVKEEDNDDKILLKAVLNEFGNEKEPEKRKCMLPLKASEIKVAILEESSNEYRAFAQKHLRGEESKLVSASTANSRIAIYATDDVNRNENRLSNLASDLHSSLHFIPPKSHTLLVLLMGVFLLSPPILRSILVREVIIFASFIMNTWTADLKLFNVIWRRVERMDRIVRGSSEVLFLWLSMAFIIFIILTLASCLTQTERSHIEHGTLLRRIIRQRIETSMNENESNGANKITPDEQRVYPYEENKHQVRNTDSLDSLDGFILAGSDAAAAAKAIRRGTRRDSFETVEQDSYDESYEDASSTRLEPDILARLPDKESNPVTCAIFGHDNDVVHDLEVQENSVIVKRSKTNMFDRLKVQAKKQVIFGARELRGAGL